MFCKREFHSARFDTGQVKNVINQRQQQTAILINSRDKLGDFFFRESARITQ